MLGYRKILESMADGKGTGLVSSSEIRLRVDIRARGQGKRLYLWISYLSVVNVNSHLR